MQNVRNQHVRFVFKTLPTKEGGDAERRITYGRPYRDTYTKIETPRQQSPISDLMEKFHSFFPEFISTKKIA